MKMVMIVVGIMLVASMGMGAPNLMLQYEKAHFLEVGEGKTKAARKIYKSIVSKHGNNPDAHAVVKLCRERLHQKSSSRKEWPIVADASLVVIVNDEFIDNELISSTLASWQTELDHEQSSKNERQIELSVGSKPKSGHSNQGSSDKTVNLDANIDLPNININVEMVNDIAEIMVGDFDELTLSVNVPDALSNWRAWTNIDTAVCMSNIVMRIDCSETPNSVSSDGQKPLLSESLASAADGVYISDDGSSLIYSLLNGHTAPSFRDHKLDADLSHTLALLHTNAGLKLALRLPSLTGLTQVLFSSAPDEQMLFPPLDSFKTLGLSLQESGENEWSVRFVGSATDKSAVAHLESILRLSMIALASELSEQQLMQSGLENPMDMIKITRKGGDIMLDIRLNAANIKQMIEVSPSVNVM